MYIILNHKIIVQYNIYRYNPQLRLSRRQLFGQSRALDPTNTHANGPKGRVHKPLGCTGSPRPWYRSFTYSFSTYHPYISRNICSQSIPVPKCIYGGCVPLPPRSIIKVYGRQILRFKLETFLLENKVHSFIKQS